MKKAIVTLSTAVVIGISAFTFTSVPTYANTQIESKIVENQQEQTKINEQIAKLQQAIEDNQNVMGETEEKIKQANEKIEQLKAEQAVLEEQIAKREDLIKARLQVMQQGGGNMTYLEVILGASDFEDLISRVSAVATITKADQDLISEQETDKQALADKEKTTQDELTNLNDLKLEYDGMQTQIAEQKAQAENIKDQLKNEESQLFAEKQEAERREAEALLAAAAATAEANVSNSTVVSNTEASSESGAKIETEVKQKENKTVKSSPAPSVSGSNAISTVTSAGYRYIGNSVYGFGSADPVNGVFDCSGFVNWAFKQAGISIGRSTSVLSGQGTKVSTSDMRVGDLVFFDTYKKDGHVGIYLGGGKFIGSQSSTGVAIADMTSGYWKNHFKGHVRRVIQ